MWVLSRTAREFESEAVVDDTTAVDGGWWMVVSVQLQQVESVSRGTKVSYDDHRHRSVPIIVITMRDRMPRLSVPLAVISPREDGMEIKTSYLQLK